MTELTPEQHADQLLRIEKNCRECVTTYTKDTLWVIEQLRAAQDEIAALKSGDAWVTAFVCGADSRRDEIAKLKTELLAAQQRIASIEKQLPDQWTIEEMHADWESKEKQNTKLDVEIHVLQQTISQLRLDIASIREQHQREWKEFDRNENDADALKQTIAQQAGTIQSLREAITKFLSSCSDESYNYVGGVERLLLEQALATPAPVAVVPWEVVKEAMDAEVAVMYACDDEFDDALKRRDAARAKLQSYAPRKARKDRDNL